MSGTGNGGLAEEIVAEIDLYRLSGMVDVLRDIAHELLGHDVSAATLTRMGDRYRRLRGELTPTLTPEAAERMLGWAPMLGPDASAGEIFDAAATLARWIDLTLGAPTFLATRRANAAEIRDVLHRLSDGEVEDTRPEGKAGQYL